MKRFYLVILLFCLQWSVRAQVESSLYGHNGLISIPTAQIIEDGQVVFGTGYIPKPFGVVEGTYKDNQIVFVTIGYLPFMELTFGTVRIINEPWGIGDRTSAFRFRLMKEKRYIPQITVGLHDPFGGIAEDWAQFLTACYLVSSKNIISEPVQVRGHFGYGVDWLKAAHYRLLGAFGGADVRYKFLSLMAEYDTEHYNYGIRISLFSHLQYSLVWLDGKTMTWGGNLSFNL
jgi:hypothetical protein